MPRANLWRARHIHVAHRTAAPPCDELATRPQLTTPHSARGARVTSSPHGRSSVPRARHTTVLTTPPEISRSACDELVTRVTSSFCPVPRHAQHILYTVVRSSYRAVLERVIGRRLSLPSCLRCSTDRSARLEYQSQPVVGRRVAWRVASAKRRPAIQSCCRLPGRIAELDRGLGTPQE